MVSRYRDILEPPSTHATVNSSNLNKESNDRKSSGFIIFFKILFKNSKKLNLDKFSILIY